MTVQQRQALRELCERYRVPFAESTFEINAYGLPPGFVAGWVGPIYVGCSPNGEISS